MKKLQSVLLVLLLAAGIITGVAALTTEHLEAGARFGTLFEIEELDFSWCCTFCPASSCVIVTP